MNEIWKTIPGFEGIYEASNLGRIRSLDRTETQKNGIERERKGRLMYATKKKSGYYCIRLSRNGVVITMLVHRAIALTFIPNPMNLPCINHKDHDKGNNCVDNLEWCTYKYNNEYSNTKEATSKAKRKRVEMLDSFMNIIHSFKSVVEASISTGFSLSGISAAATGRQRTCGGYYWRYKTTAE